MYSLNLYLGFRMSLRDVREHLPWTSGASQPRGGSPVGAPRQPRREALLPEAAEARKPHRPRRVQGSGRMVGLALGGPQDPQRRVVLQGCTSPRTRNGLIARSFMKKLMGKYGGDVVFVTDGGKWYPWAAESLGARWVWP